MAIITEAFQNGFRNDFELQFQQGVSRLRSTVMEFPQNVEIEFYDRIAALGASSVTQKTVRHAPTVLNDADHSRIACFLADYQAPTLAFDNEDKLRMRLNDPRFKYAENQAKALGRKLDSIIIAAATGTTYTGKSGTGTEAYTAATYGIAVNAVAPGNAAVNSNLTVEKLIQAKSKFGVNESVDENEQLTFVLSQAQLDSLLRTAEVTSIDYNAIKALVRGDVDTFMGFKFIRTQLLTITGTVRTCLAYPKSAIILGMAEGVKTKIDERPDLNYTWQVWAQTTFGAVRTWREKIVSVDCDEAA